MTIRTTGMAGSRRARELPASPIRALARLAAEAKTRGIEVIHLNIGQPDLDPPPTIVESLASARQEPLVYAPTRGTAGALGAWSAYYRHHGIEVETDELLITSGASEALQLAFLATCDPGDEVLVPEPFFAPYKGMAAISGIRLVPVPFGEGFAPPPVAEIAARISPRTKALLICSPNNPTGTVYPTELLAEIGRLCHNAGLFLLSDETYRELVFAGPAAPSTLSLPGLEAEVVVIDSVSKRFNACGLRIGALVTRNIALMKTILEIAELRLAVPAVEQRIVQPALHSPEPYVSEVVATYRGRVATIVEALNQIDGVVCHHPAGAFYVVAQLPVASAEDFAAWLLSNFALDGTTVLLTPMSDFYVTSSKGLNEVRLACVVEEEVLRQAAGILDRGLFTYLHRSDEDS